MRKRDTHTLVFYSEGKQYHNVFSPILLALDQFDYPYTYLTSSQEDYDLYHISPPKNPNATFAYIGDSNSNAAIAQLNSLKADLVVMTTPQLDVLQIKRSKGVKHYCHIIHSLPHIDIYEIFALDYFDSVLTNSPIHTDFIRQVESKRALKHKQVIITGCTYLDVLAQKLQDYRQTQEKFAFFPQQKAAQNHNQKVDSSQSPKAALESTFSKDSACGLESQSGDETSLNLLESTFATSTTPTAPTILIAPSWGREALLSKYGFAIIKPFINTRFQLIIRPHPQSYLSETSILQELQEHTKQCKNIVWDSNRDNIYALDAADVMIGDFSGVLFDFVCLFEKPVLTPEFTFCNIGYDLEDIYPTPWVQSALPRIGKQFHPKDLHHLPTIIESMLGDKDSMQESLRAMKQELWHFQGSGGKQSARALLAIESQILESSLGHNLPLHKRILAIQKILATPALESSTQISLDPIPLSAHQAKVSKAHKPNKQGA
ncbi:CDP-glycerol glycerophosphotransferase family protein [Helicobacter sp. XJK30-2]|uniref:CDP-glycerol glycerophosphotransferase family protein n=1 Tax=Helicobacter zhangjianzhongii TaxID=2974574 RepID=A0ACC6FS54_9HELI|nr:CDP-glycerol glycerophosphotransferase family protein [Helicobacter sp. XJK30-2]MDL0082061.1 CDP-glycerol glycerophosphotransferase family protein [Helicobacter sp. XJK30-2]